MEQIYVFINLLELLPFMNYRSVKHFYGDYFTAIKMAMYNQVKQAACITQIYIEIYILSGVWFYQTNFVGYYKPQPIHISNKDDSIFMEKERKMKHFYSD